MSMPFKLKFTLTTDEFLSAQRVYNRSLAPPIARFSYRYAVPAGVLLLVDAAAGFALRWNIGVCLGLAVFAGYLILCRTIIAPRRARREFAQYRDLDREVEFDFGEEKILVQTSLARSEIDWARFARFAETDKLIVLFAPPRFLYTIPKRALSPGEFVQFSELLRLKLPGR